MTHPTTRLDAAPAGPGPEGPGAAQAGVQSMNLLGVRISALTLPRAVATIEAAIDEGRRGYICIRDAHGLVRAQKDEALRRAHNRAFLVTADGMPLVWALRLAGHRDASRVYGPDLMLALFDSGRGRDTRHFLYGATPRVLDRLSERLTRRFPGARIVGRYAPPFRDLTRAETEEVAGQINRSGANIVWVGLGTPKQELWMAEMRPLLAPEMLIGVGAAFDFHAGLKPQAPRLLRHSGLEWAFRLACEPRRLARRYAVTVPSFAALALGQALGLRPMPLSDDPAAAPGLLREEAK